MSASTYDDLVAEHERLTALKAWTLLPAIEAAMKRLKPARIELAQDSYYYGTAADFTGPAS